MTTIRTPAEAIHAIAAIAAYGNPSLATGQEFANLLTGMELALGYPEWCLALLNLAGRRSIQQLLHVEIAAIVKAHPIETEVTP